MSKCKDTNERIRNERMSQLEQRVELLSRVAFGQIHINDLEEGDVVSGTILEMFNSKAKPITIDKGEVKKIGNRLYIVVAPPLWMRLLPWVSSYMTGRHHAIWCHTMADIVLHKRVL